MVKNWIIILFFLLNITISGLPMILDISTFKIVYFIILTIGWTLFLTAFIYFNWNYILIKLRFREEEKSATSYSDIQKGLERMRYITSGDYLRDAFGVSNRSRKSEKDKGKQNE
ncbi:MAG: hypothetical protein OXN84_04155 [Albidovulum sp.]|nr:hypothetical protein [Albidovulum sp.]